MAKEGIITTSGLNCYGGRVLTSGGILTQFEKNPVLLYMHRRGFDGKTMPIGRIENLRIDGDKLIGTPVFDEKDEFARQIGQKWEDGFLRMFSAGIEIIETSAEASLMLPGQTRPTITKWKLEEVSIVDIGGNDEALRLSYQGKILNLFAGEDSDVLPILSDKEHSEGPESGLTNINQKNNNNSMNKEILQLLGLTETASEQEAVNALRLLKEKADKAESLQLASINALVDGAVAERRITSDKKEHFVNLGKTSGIEALRTTLELMQPQRKPTEVIQPRGSAPERGSYAKLSEVPASEVASLKESNPTEYARLYRAEYGIEV